MGFNCYIDESGDEGIGTGGTRWFILGALIVPDHLDLVTSRMVHEIKQGLGKPDKWVLHWARQRNHDKKLFICTKLLTQEWRFSCVAVDKEHSTILNSASLRRKSALYFYSTRLLAERLSWYARARGQRANLIFEHRSNMSYDDMRDYLERLRTETEDVNIYWDHIDCQSFRMEQKAKSRLLQAVDCVCGAVSDALEYSQFGNLEPRYITTLAPRFYRSGGNLTSYGLKFLHANAGTLTELRQEYDWLNKL